MFGLGWILIDRNTTEYENITYPLPSSLSCDKPVQQVQVYLFSIDGGGKLEASPEMKNFVKTE